MKRTLRAQFSLPLCLTLLLTLGSVNTSLSQVTAVPQLMNFQGRLTKPDGTPVSDGSYALRFSLWDAQSGGTEKWSQTLNPVALKNGTFAVLLSGFPAGTFQGNLWLEIKIGQGSPLSPRQPLVSVAYAFKAESIKDGGVTSGSLANSAVTSVKIANGTIIGADIANGTITANKFASGIFNPLVWLLEGNSGTNSASHFIGTTDNQPLVFKVNKQRALQMQTVQSGNYLGNDLLGDTGRTALGRVSRKPRSLVEARSAPLSIPTV